ncbi:MAG: hypothetical protein LBK96_04855 [Prevotellaceae bacterium]|jgi:hypothetical protein|nr:hypothetical protein [Prevotellaceae bacterium]
MFQVIGNLMASVFWGVLIALLLTVILVYFPRMIYSRYGHKLAGIVLLIAGFCFFTFQSMLWVGGFKLKGYIPSVGQVEQLGIAVERADTFGDELANAYPMLKPFIGKTEQETIRQSFSDQTDLITFYVREVRHKINRYLWRRTGWIAAGLLLLGCWLANDASKQSRRQNNSFMEFMEEM